jgi:hypothetical protein
MKNNLTKEQLIDTSKGLHYRFFQMRDVLITLSFLSKCPECDFIRIIKNASVESFLISLRCLLEFFDPKTIQKKITKGSRSCQSHVEDYFDKENYLKMKKLWQDNFLKDPISNTQITFTVTEDFLNKEKKYHYKEIQMRIHSHLAHQGAWIVPEKEQKKGRLNYKIAEWNLGQFYNKINILINAWYNLVSKNDDTLLHDVWRQMEKSSHNNN